MQESIRENTGKQENIESEKILAGFIASALDIEDRVAESIYVDYMKRDAWPAEMRAESFESIRSYLTVLIKDTQKHRRMLLSLQKGLNTDAKD